MWYWSGELDADWWDSKNITYSKHFEEISCHVLLNGCYLRGSFLNITWKVLWVGIFYLSACKYMRANISTMPRILVQVADLKFDPANAMLYWVFFFIIPFLASQSLLKKVKTHLIRIDLEESQDSRSPILV